MSNKDIFKIKYLIRTYSKFFFQLFQLSSSDQIVLPRNSFFQLDVNLLKCPCLNKTEVFQTQNTLNLRFFPIRSSEHFELEKL